MKQTVTGVTLVELLIVMALLGVLTVIAMPGFGQFFAKRAVVAGAASLASDFRFARAEAIKRSGFVTLCRSTNGSTCATTQASWHTGWIVFSDYDGDGTVDSAEDQILRVQQELSGVASLANATPGNTLLRATFRPNGMGAGVSEAFLVQASASTAAGTTRVLCISAMGRSNLLDQGQSTC